jgi:hypothetical protein
MVRVLGEMTGDGGPGLDSMCDSETGKILAYIADALSNRPFPTGEEVTLADIQMTYFLDMASTVGLLDSFPVLQAYLDPLTRQTGFRPAESKGGQMKVSRPKRASFCDATQAVIGLECRKSSDNRDVRKSVFSRHGSL